MRRGQIGFSMIELAVAMFILTLLLGSILVPLGAQVQQRQISETQKILEQIQDALLGHAVSVGYLPCPDTNGDGYSDPHPFSGGVCTSQEGALPWATLNVPAGDSWGNRFRYRISPDFTNTKATTCIMGDFRIGLCDTGDITVNTRASNKTIQTVGSNVVAVVLSHGKNGYGATSTSGLIRPGVPSSNVDETTNADATNTTFVTRTPTESSDSCNDATDSSIPYCEFDDILISVSRFNIFNRMVAAGVLP